jgi:hypothetical protein
LVNEAGKDVVNEMLRHLRSLFRDRVTRVSGAAAGMA